MTDEAAEPTVLEELATGVHDLLGRLRLELTTSNVAAVLGWLGEHDKTAPMASTLAMGTEASTVGETAATSGEGTAPAVDVPSTEVPSAPEHTANVEGTAAQAAADATAEAEAAKPAAGVASAVKTTTEVATGTTETPPDPTGPEGVPTPEGETVTIADPLPAAPASEVPPEVATWLESKGWTPPKEDPA